ncbi:MAG: tetraacyldisaccharide 4'-kinase [Gemmatimonadaceae bacterium]
MRGIERVWYGDALSARVGRALLTPFEFGYRAAMASRNRLYDARLLAVHAPSVPAISVGNLSVGGTGKTPVAAFIVTRLRELGARPAIVLRGYGDDETQVHARLNPGVVVVVDPDRVQAGIRARNLGCDVLVMDDAFQHRRAGRTVDLVLVSAERFVDHPRLLPAGPWREGWSSLQRASLVLVTRKSATPERARLVAERISTWSEGPVGIAALQATRLVGAFDANDVEMGALSGKRVLVVTGIADPDAFASQLRAVDWDVDLRGYRDHYPFAARDVEEIVSTARTYDAVVCTLKDAVKLTPQWPRSAPPLWYVSQRVVPEWGAEHLDAAIERVLNARP